MLPALFNLYDFHHYLKKKLKVVLIAATALLAPTPWDQGTARLLGSLATVLGGPPTPQRLPPSISSPS